nr:MAG TPA: hypothetical protein [Caudoviricetes sp.]
MVDTVDIFHLLSWIFRQLSPIVPTMRIKKYYFESNI